MVSRLRNLDQVFKLPWVSVFLFANKKVGQTFKDALVLKI